MYVIVQPLIILFYYYRFIRIYYSKFLPMYIYVYPLGISGEICVLKVHRQNDLPTYAEIYQIGRKKMSTFDQLKFIISEKIYPHFNDS